VTWNARIAAVILFFHLFWAKTFLVENAFFRKELGRNSSPVVYASGADMSVESGFAGAHTPDEMGEPMYQPGVEVSNGSVVEESERAVASVVEFHSHAKVNDQFSQLDDSSLLLFDPRT
jgi:hypothetical protein